MASTDLTSTGIILLTVVAIAWGGTFLLRVVSGAVPANALQRSYFRAGHAHAGMLLTLGRHRARGRRRSMARAQAHRVLLAWTGARAMCSGPPVPRSARQAAGWRAGLAGLVATSLTGATRTVW